LRVADYETNGLIGLGWPAYYAQIGAGIWPISAPLTRIDKPAGARALEIGGAYGFGVDFCVQARGWQGEGYDPSPLAGIGAQELGLDIRQGYFTAANLTDGPWDVIVSTEVVEHLDQPPAFLALMRQALAADGILMLTTPNAEWITPALPPGELFALLAPRAHLVLQTARSLRLALEQAGFTHVLVLEDAATLVAYASCTPFTLNEDAAAGRAIYRRYLAERATRAAPGSDLHLGFAGRALFDSVNDADAAGVEAAWASLRAGVRARFGYELESLTTLPLGCAGTGLAGLARQIPLGLGMILFSWVMHRLSQGGDRAKLRPVLQLAGEAVSALQAALRLHELGEDRLSVNIGDIVQQELLLCAAEAAEPESVAGLLARGDIVAGWRGFVALVNAGAFTLAAELMDGLLPALPSEDVSAGLRHDALLSLANFYLAPGADAARVFPVAEALGEGGAEILLGGFTRLVNASRYEEAVAVARRYNIPALARGAGAAARDARLTQIVLDLAVGDPAEIPARLQDLEVEPERCDVLLLEAFIRLVNASRYDEALEFITTHDVSALAARVGGEVAKNTGLARMVLDLAVGDPAEIPARLRGLDIDPERRDVLLLEAFIRLVNASRYDEALEFITTHDVTALAVRVGGEVAKNTGLARMVLDLAVGDPAEIPVRLQDLEVEPERRDVLLLEAFIRLVNASRYDEALAFITTHRVPELLRSAGTKTGADAAIALAVLELELGDPALVPGHLAGLDVPPERAEALILGTFTELVNTARYDEAEVLAAAEPCFARLPDMQGEAAADARFATMMLDLQRGRVASAVEKMAALERTGTDAAALNALYVDAFIRLVNDGDFALARQMAEEVGVERRLPHCAAPARQDALVALLLQELQPGGNAARVPDRVTALRPTQISAAHLRKLTLIAFTTLVNQQEITTARALLAPVEPELLTLHPPFDPAGRDALFAAGALYLEDEQEWRRSATCFGRLRDGLAKSAPPGMAPEPLFWPALRGEVVALHRLERYEEATLLLREFIGTYPDAPEDLRQQIEPHETLNP
jgi:hypothetical protein